jgi:hypothetical protein
MAADDIRLLRAAEKQIAVPMEVNIGIAIA